MKFSNKKASNVKLAYIGGGSRGWAWGLMMGLGADERSGGGRRYER